MIRCEGFASQVRDPVTNLVVARLIKAAPIAVMGMHYGDIGVAAIAVFEEVWRV